MADISKIKLPSDDTVYDIKDAVARAAGKVSGVKGNAESTYRTGNVNITPANIGTIPLSTGGTGQTSAVEGNWALQNRGYCSDANEALSVGIYNTNTNTLNLPALAYSQNNGCGVLLCYVSTASTHNNSNNWIWQLWLNTTTSDLYKRKKINASAWGSWTADTDTAATLKTARTLNVSGQATGTAQSFNGSQNVSIPITSYNTQGLARPSGIRGVADNTLQALFNTTRANRLAFLPADQIIIEKTTDGGVTWVDAGVSDTTKLGLFSETRHAVNFPQIDGVRSPLCGIRVTFTAMKYNVPENTPETEKYNYWNSTYIKSAERYNQLKDFYFWLSASDGSIKIKIEGAMGSAANNWETLFNDPSYYMTGWSGNDYVHLSAQRVFGGSVDQTSNRYWNYRMTFMSWGKNGTDDFDTGSKTQIQNISEIRGYGDSWWTAGNTYAALDRIYSQDMNKNVTFPANLAASNFIGQGGALTALNGSNITQGTVAAARIANLDASKITSGTLPVERGGTGQATSTAAAQAFVNALSAQFTTPQDADYFISQSVGGGSTTTTYHRRPMSALWEYVVSKISSVLGLTSTTYGGSSAKVNNHTVQSDVPENAVFTDNNTTYTLSQDAQDGHKITFTPSTGSSTTITVPDNDTTYTGTAPIVVTGSSITHANSGVTAASKGDTSAQAPSFGGTFKVTSGTVNATGHLTEFAEHTVTIPNTLASANGPGLMSAADKGALTNLDTRLSDVEDTLANIDLSDPDAAIYALALRVAALESHALLDDGYPTVITPAVSFDSTDNSLSIS